MLTCFRMNSQLTKSAGGIVLGPDNRVLDVSNVAEMLTHPKDKAFFVKCLDTIETYAQ